MASTQLQIQIQGNASGFVQAVSKAASTLGNLKPVTKDAILAFQELKIASEKALQIKGGSSGIPEQAAAVGSLKQQYREAVKEVQNIIDKFGYTSKEAAQAAKKAAEFKDQIGDANDLVAAFNPDAKFAAVSKSIQAAASAGAIFQGTLALIGVENKDLEKQLLKVQAALAISQGFQSLGQSIEGFKQLSSVIQNSSVFIKANELVTRLATQAQLAFGIAVDTTSVSFRVLKGAIAATGIGLLIVGIGEVVSALQSWTSSAEKAIEAQNRLKEQTLKGSEAALAAEIRFVDREEKLAVAKAKAMRKSEQEILEIQQSFRRSRINAYSRYIKENAGLNDLEVDKAKEAIKELNVEGQVANLDFISNGFKDQTEKSTKELDTLKENIKSKIKEATELGIKLPPISLDSSKGNLENYYKDVEKVINTQLELRKKVTELDSQYLDIEISNLKGQLEDKKKLNQETTSEYIDLQNKLFDLTKLRLEREYAAQKEAILKLGDETDPLVKKSLENLQKIYDQNVIQLGIEVYVKPPEEDFSNVLNKGKNGVDQFYKFLPNLKPAATGVDYFKGIIDEVIKSWEKTKPELADSLSKIKDDFAGQLNTAYENFRQAALNAPVDAFIAVGEALGSLLEEGIGGSLAKAAESVLKIIGGVLKQLGAYIITAAEAIKTMQAAINQMLGFPQGSIAAGILLVAIGTLLSSVKIQSRKPIQAFAEGGIVTSPMLGMVGEAGREAIIPLSRFDEVVGSRGATDVFVTGMLSGEMIFLQQQRAIKRRDRVV